MKNNCLECGSGFRGRSDKKFCNDTCRSSYNNRRYRSDQVYIKQVNIALRKNRSILEQLYSLGKKEVEKALLIGQGFNFNYYTGVRNNDYGKQCYLVYDLGYHIQKPGKVALLRETVN